jgi:hypothetical protein
MKNRAAPGARRRAMTLTRRQLLLGLVDRGFFTGAQALAAAQSGTMPPTLEATVAALPNARELEVRISWATAASFTREDSVITALAAAWSKSDRQIDSFFTAYAAV